jgi:small GTP-binding protein
MARDVFKAKICLVGQEGVGKSSLARRFVYNEFSDRYQPTIGANIARKNVTVELPSRPVDTILTLWDIMGESSFLQLLKDAYFAEVQGVLAVGDLTRPETVRALSEWVDAAFSVSGPVPVVLLGNKADLPEAQGTREALAEIGASLSVKPRHTSAKTGDGVGEAFASLAEAIVRAADAARQ